MLQHNFIDHVRVCCRAGKGGDGIVHFHREKYVPKGGPDGGDGGRGGHVILRGNSQMWTLLHLRYRKHVIAEDGAKGGSKNQSGKQGKDLYLDVPLGTLAKDLESGEKIGEVVNDEDTIIVALGGKGGKGNHHFKSSTDQAPEYAEEGEQGETNWRIFELQLLADVGLVGYPNAGKSTLLSVLSAAKPEVADYPFTTITPNLGVVFYEEFASFVIADLPGLVQGAHEGKGQGFRFLRHVERNAVLLFLVSSESLEVNEEYQTLLAELWSYDPALLQKKRILAVSKADLLDPELKQQLASNLPAGINAFFISAHTGEGIREIKSYLWKTLNESSEAKYEHD